MEWTEVSKELPKSGNYVLAVMPSYEGKPTVIRAMYAAKFTLEAGFDADEAGCDWHEGEGTYYAPEGWFEVTERDDDYPYLGNRVTHWMPLPKPPASRYG